VPVIGEGSEPVLTDAWIRGEQQADLHHVVQERSDGLRPTDVQRVEVPEDDAADLVTLFSSARRTDWRPSAGRDNVRPGMKAWHLPAATASTSA
jgi:hypothetical protein